ncbi:MAG: hypothetical protein ACRD6X_21250 [Pyrinomonadaceae bacterium]
MLMRVLWFTLSLLFLNLAITPSILASGNSEKEAKFAEKVKLNIRKLGTGKDTNVKLKLRDGTKIKGYVTEVSDEEFVVVESNTGQTVTVSYTSVKQVRGNNLSTGVTILIGIGVLILVIILVSQGLN